MRTGRLAAMVAGLVATAPARASAHLVQTGFGGFYDGLVHWAITPRDALVVIGLALLAGLRGAGAARFTLVALPLAWLAGGAMGYSMPGSDELAIATTLSFGLAGLLVAVDTHMPRWVLGVFVLVAGFLHGMSNGLAMSASGMGWLGLIGAVTAVFVVASLLPAFVTVLRRPAARVAVRVAGSWIAAIAMLMLGWLIRGAGA